MSYAGKATNSPTQKYNLQECFIQHLIIVVINSCNYVTYQYYFI